MLSTSINPKENNLLEILDLGLTSYKDSYEIQKEYVEKVKQNPNTSYLIFTEHHPVITLGRKEKENTIKYPIPSFYIERGGRATFHNPGQLVFYPIFYLTNHNISGFIRKLENIIIKTFSDFNLDSYTKDTGVWVSDKKIASIGIAVSKWVTYHGCAINVSNDLSGFFYINPCGLEPSQMGNLKMFLNPTPSIKEIKNKISINFHEF